MSRHSSGSHNHRSPFSSKRRSSIISEITSTHLSVSTLTLSTSSEEDLTKALLGPKKNGSSIISKRRGSAVSIDSIQSNSRRNSIVLIEDLMTIGGNNCSQNYVNTSSIMMSSNTQPTLIVACTATTTIPPPPPPPPPINNSNNNNKNNNNNSNNNNNNHNNINNINSSNSILEDDFCLGKISLDSIDTQDFISMTRNGLLLFPSFPKPPKDSSNDIYDHPESDTDTYPSTHNRTSRKSSVDHTIHHSRSFSDSSTISPIPFFNSGRPLVPSANYDNHYQYKQRNRQTSKKLTNFFGDKPPMDICVREIEKEGLKAMLHSKVPLCYFLYSLLEEYSSENLFFFLEVEQYESYDYMNSSQQFATASHIFDTYLTHNSQFEVNVDDKVRKSVIAALKSPREPRRCFDDAKRAIFLLLEVSFARFIRGPMAEQMKREIGEITTQYSPKARDAAVRLLLKFLERQASNFKELSPNQHGRSKSKNLINIAGIASANFISSNNNNNNTKNPTSPTSLISRKRYELVRTMISEFVRTLLNLDLERHQYDSFRNRSWEPASDSWSGDDSNGSSTNNNEYESWDCIGGGGGGVAGAGGDISFPTDQMHDGKSTRVNTNKKRFRKYSIKNGIKIV
ncbi:hypothetical protein G9A89_014467 [Geosiphon pyriformis]|nr:hypothetical protein G9A89_014467 [Geosiphon pyriformis]